MGLSPHIRDYFSTICVKKGSYQPAPVPHDIASYTFKMMHNVQFCTIAGKNRVPTVTTGLVLALIHRIVALGALHSKSLGSIIKGEKQVLFLQDKIVRKNMMRCCVSHEDLMEEVRLNLNECTMDNVKQIYMERSGEISIIKK